MTIKAGEAERFLSEVKKQIRKLVLKIKELYSEVEHKTRIAAISDVHKAFLMSLGTKRYPYYRSVYSKMLKNDLKKKFKVFGPYLKKQNVWVH